MHITPSSKRPHPSILSKRDWIDLITPEKGEGEQVILDQQQQADPLDTIQDVRDQVDKLTFLPIDPFVASIAGTVSAGRVELPEGESIVELELPDYYQDTVEVQMHTPHGENAPMMVILPGVQGSGNGSLGKQMKKIALEHGMNYVAIPNALGEEMMDDEPIYHPGNPRSEAIAVQQVIEKLKDQHPAHFRKISLAGYSYGGLLGANVIRLQEEQGRDLINGSFVALSPPENLSHSMTELDALREKYKDDDSSITWMGLKYKRHVAKYGYERFMESDLSQRGEGTNITEIKTADRYGSRDDHEVTTDTVDQHFAHNLLPKHTQEYQEAGFFKRRRMRAEHQKLLKATNYDEYSKNYMSHDKWLEERGLTPEEVANRYSFSEAMKVIDDTPTMLLVSADDYILNDDDVEAFREIEAEPGELEAVRVFEKGGHVGILWNPEVQNLVGDFAHQAPQS